MIKLIKTTCIISMLLFSCSFLHAESDRNDNTIKQWYLFVCKNIDVDKPHSEEALKSSLANHTKNLKVVYGYLKNKNLIILIKADPSEVSNLQNVHKELGIGAVYMSPVEALGLEEFKLDINQLPIVLIKTNEVKMKDDRILVTQSTGGLLLIHSFESKGEYFE